MATHVFTEEREGRVSLMRIVQGRIIQNVDAMQVGKKFATPSIQEFVAQLRLLVLPVPPSLSAGAMPVVTRSAIFSI